MIAALGRRIGSISRPRTTLALLGVLCLFVPVFVLCAANAGDAALPGLQPGYSADEAYRALRQMGEYGRRWFAAFQLVDFGFIPTYALLFATTISWTYRRVFGLEGRWTGLCLVPVLAATVDYAETACLLALVIAYPLPLVGLASAASVLTSVKWALVGGSLLLALLGLAGVAIKSGRAPSPLF
jgi:hypothetical protein